MTNTDRTRSLAAIPCAFLLSSCILFGAMLHSEKQTRRYWLVVPFLVSAYASLASHEHFWFSSDLLTLWNLSVQLYTLHSISLLCIEQVPAPTNPPGLSKVRLWKWRVKTTYRQWGNPRRIPASTGTCHPREVIRFLVTRVLKLLVYYFVHQHVMPAVQHVMVGRLAPWEVNKYHSKLSATILRALTPQSYGTVITSRSLLLRTHTALFWIWESIAFLDGANAALALFFVGVLRLDQPADWPPLFGFITDATSLSRFWASFWHRLPARPYKTIGRLVAGKLLGCRARSTTCNVVVALVVFALSGAVHSYITWQADYWDWQREFVWYMLNFAGCTGEKAVVSFARTQAKRSGLGKQLDAFQRSWVGSMVGYVWVFGFFLWTVPYWKYPRMLRAAQLDIITRIAKS